MGPRMRNESGESKRNVTCGICNQTGRRDNMRRNHFPKKHPGIKYFEKGDKISKAAIDFFALKKRDNVVNNVDEPSVDNDSESDNDNETNDDAGAIGDESNDMDGAID